MEARLTSAGGAAPGAAGKDRVTGYGWKALAGSAIGYGAMQKIIDGMERYCADAGVNNIRDLTGQVKLDRQLSDRWLRFAQQSG